MNSNNIIWRRRLFSPPLSFVISTIISLTADLTSVKIYSNFYEILSSFIERNFKMLKLHHNMGHNIRRPPLDPFER